MLPTKATLVRLVKSRLNFFLYGPKGSGKTTLIQETFKQANIECIYLNCTITDKKSNFFKYLNHQLNKFIKEKIKTLAEEGSYLDIEYTKPTDPNNVYSFIGNIKKLDTKLIDEIKKIYFFIDCVEQMILSPSFLTSFYDSCQEEFLSFRIPFVFCGVTLPRKIYQVDRPFRSITAFCMQRPTQLMKTVIQEVVQQDLFEQSRQKKSFGFETDDIKQAARMIQVQIFFSFQSLESNLRTIKVISHRITENIVEMVKSDWDKIQGSKLKKVINSYINNGKLRQIFKEIKDARYNQEGVGNYKNKNEPESNKKKKFQSNQCLPHQFYPNLLISALYLADRGNETYDKFRFKDYKGTKSFIPKTKNQFNVQKHNIQRVIAIAESLESINMGKKTFKEKLLQHHSLDFYNCFQFLREEKTFMYQYKNPSFATSKVHGTAKKEDVGSFLKEEMDLIYDDFIYQ